MKQQKRSPHDQETVLTAPFVLHAQSIRRQIARPFSCLVLLLSLLLGLLIGVLGTLLYISSAHDASVLPSQPVPGEAAIVIQLSSTYLSQVVTKEINQASMPGNLNNIQVKMAHSAPIIIRADDQINFLGFTTTRPVTLRLQPIVRACQLKVSITHADFSGIPVTSFVSSFEQQINQQLTNGGSSSLLPKSFIYCITNVRTETNGIFVTYAARPI